MLLRVGALVGNLGFLILREIVDEATVGARSPNVDALPGVLTGTASVGWDLNGLSFDLDVVIQTWR